MPALIRCFGSVSWWPMEVPQGNLMDAFVDETDRIMTKGLQWDDTYGATAFEFAADKYEEVRNSGDEIASIHSIMTDDDDDMY